MRDKSKIRDKSKAIGYIIILFGLISNEYSIKIISNYETRFDTLGKSLILIVFQLIIIITGIYIIKKGKKAAINIALLLFSTSAFIIFFEIILTLFFSNDTSKDRPLWIPAKYKKENNRINADHKLTSLHNSYGFNDSNHSLTKEKNIDFRIAILGDSFVWGFGVPDSVIWTKKLLKKLSSRSSLKYEILNWGKPGWSTQNEFNFLKSEGKKYDFDFLIFTFVVNDPIMNNSAPKEIILQDGFVQRKILDPVARLLPNTVSFFTDVTNNIFATYFNYGYTKWLEKEVYTTENLYKYSELLKEINLYCKQRNIKFIFVLTPENYNPQIGEYFNKITNLLDQQDIKYYNLYPSVKKELDKYSIRELWANPADGHPGNKVTDVYAKYVYDFLIKDTI